MCHQKSLIASRSFNIFSEAIKHLQREIDITRGRHPIPEDGIKALQNLNVLFKITLSQLVSARISENPMFRRYQSKSSLEQTADIIDKILDKDNYTSWIGVGTKKN
ncbi:MAG: hypothetical protein VR66_19365 [Peptococcaceae bacterium BRH_c23]|nr:MAG: hypothetical protein VR66_19365 [Peptococcaceae bacterium BRH_c23]KJS89317.1 MAG: hypothetical protein JL57_08170 [Desulfosporosinus sp. BICA1-9]KJS90704.1 MAG: hypothetical protein JL57_00355 [Desulfosporosinus sp. BICA1-9]HBW34453.1 hypothetical protein [Desulfosporosinus sp.]